MLGINIVGIREIAKSKTENLDTIFSQIFKINLLLTIIALIAYVLMFILVEELHQYKDLLFIGSFKLLFNLFLIEWFYNGMENFKYITQRSIIVKSLYVIAIFLFVKSGEDFLIYYSLTICIIIINAIINWQYRKGFVKLSLYIPITKQILVPILIVGLYSLLTSMYNSFNVTYLGFVSGPKEVGYYTTANKLYTILLAIFSSFTGVMLPRISSLISENKKDEVKVLIKKAFEILFIFSPLLLCFTEPLAADIVNLLSGKGYEGAIAPMRIILPLVLVIGIEQILIMQLLMPLKQDKAVFINSIIGASIGLLINFTMVNAYKSIGSSVAWVMSEVAVLFCSYYFVRKVIKIDIPTTFLMKNLLLASPIVLICIVAKYFTNNSFFTIVLAGFLSGIYLIIIRSWYLKNEIIKGLMCHISQRINGIIKHD